jgi:hypothetical protein
MRRDGGGNGSCTEVGVDEIVGVVELHHGVWFPGAVCFDVFFQTLDDEVVVCMVFLLDVRGVVRFGVRGHFG